MFTIREELGTVNGLTVTIIGDLKNGRTVHSLIKVLSLYDVKINFVSPDILKIPEMYKDLLRRAGVSVYETAVLDDVIESTDVLYVTRIQKERFVDLKEYEKVFGCYVIDNKVMRKAKVNSILFVI